MLLLHLNKVIYKSTIQLCYQKKMMENMSKELKTDINTFCYDLGNLNVIPNEIITKILDFIEDGTDICNLMETCKYFYNYWLNNIDEENYSVICEFCIAENRTNYIKKFSLSNNKIKDHNYIEEFIGCWDNDNLEFIQSFLIEKIDKEFIEMRFEELYHKYYCKNSTKNTTCYLLKKGYINIKNKELCLVFSILGNNEELTQLILDDINFDSTQSIAAISLCCGKNYSISLSKVITKSKERGFFDIPKFVDTFNSILSKRNPDHEMECLKILLEQEIANPGYNDCELLKETISHRSIPSVIFLLENEKVRRSISDTYNILKIAIELRNDTVFDNLVKLITIENHDTYTGIIFSCLHHKNYHAIKYFIEKYIDKFHSQLNIKKILITACNTTYDIFLYIMKIPNIDQYLNEECLIQLNCSDEIDIMMYIINHPKFKCKIEFENLLERGSHGMSKKCYEKLEEMVFNGVIKFE